MASPVSDAPLPPGVALILEHPEGSQIFLVGVAHVSAEAVRDAQLAISNIAPTYVALGVDEKRYKNLLERASLGDRYGIRDIQKNFFERVAMAWSGRAMTYLVVTMEDVAGALLGVPAGSDILAATATAEQVDANIVLIDRDLDVSMKRLQARLAAVPPPHVTQRSNNALGMQPVSVELRESNKPSSSGAPAQIGSSTEGRPPSVKDMDTWNTLLKRGGCDNAEEVLRAFRRILTDASLGLEPDPQDILPVRCCGRVLVETFRRKTTKEGENAIRELERAAMAQLHRARGDMNPATMEAVSEAFNEVVGHERDVIMARRMWETGAMARGQAVVGVVSASHVPGIAQHWANAGHPESAHLTTLYLQTPPEFDPAVNAIPMLLLGAGFAYLAYRAPRIAAIGAGLAAVLTAPPLGFATVALGRWQRFATNVVKAAQRLDNEMGGGAGFAYDAANL